MKCPYRNFEYCVIEKCPACNYEVVETVKVEGRYPHYMSEEDAIERGCAWKTTEISYKFISCKLADGGVQPVLRNNNVYNNTTKTSVTVNKSIF